MLPALLVLAFLLTPLIEIYLIIQVGQVIGAWQTIGLLIVESLLGGWLVRREGRRAWRALRGGLSAGRMPDRELADGALVLVGGTLLLTPGFLTDVVGFFLVLPFTRPLARRWLTGWLTRRAVRHMVQRPATRLRWGRVVPGQVVEGQVVDGQVVEGQVVEGQVVDGTDGRPDPPRGEPGRR